MSHGFEGSTPASRQPVPRMLVLEVPDWPVVAAGCEPFQPCAVVTGHRVVAVTPAARQEGVRTGMRTREAQARCPEISVLKADPGHDARSWEPVVTAVEAFVPKVEVLGSGALCFETRGPSRYFGGDSALAGRLVEAIGKISGRVGCRVGVADGLFAARLAARACPPEGKLVVPGGESARWLSPQPVGVLGEEFADLADLLRRLGVHTLGDLAALPEPSVLGRFGTAGVIAHRLAGGLDEHPFQARVVPPDLAVGMELDPPEPRVEAVAFAAKALADELLRRLESAGLVCTKVAVEVETEHGERQVRQWRHEGDLSARALSERTRWQLEGWLSSSLGGPTGGITLLNLNPLEVHPDRGRQLDFWGGQADSDARASRAFARVQGILGPDAVVTAVLTGGRSPADQIRFVAWGDARDTDPGSEVAHLQDARRGRRKKPGIAEKPPPWPGRLGSPSPALVFAEPTPAEVRDDMGIALEVSGRGGLSAIPASVSISGGAWRDVAAWAGPWPMEERWWDRSGRRRARLQVLLDGGEAHLLIRESGRWWVEASYA